MRTLIAVLAFGSATSALAGGGLKNGDSREYRVVMKVDGKDDLKSMPVNANTAYDKTCEAFPCILEIKDTGEKTRLTTKDESVEIKSGKFTVKL
jgi:hypothetical protein